MASAKLMTPKTRPAYYALTANVEVEGQIVRKYSRFDFDPTVLKTRKQRDNAAIEAALVFERQEQEKAQAAENGQNKPFRVVAQEYIDSCKSNLVPSLRLEGDYEYHKNKANTTIGKEKMLRRICQLSPLADLPISSVNKKECEKFLALLGETDIRSRKGYAVLKPDGKQKKDASCAKIAKRCGLRPEAVERAFRGNHIRIDFAHKIATAVGCQTEELFDLHVDHRPISRKSIKEYANFFRLVMQYAADLHGRQDPGRPGNAKTACRQKLCGVQ